MPRAKQSLCSKNSSRILRSINLTLLGVVSITFFGLSPTTAKTHETPSVARAHFSAEGRAQGGGTCFFIPAGTKDSVVAICTAHAFKLPELALAEVVEFRLGSSRKLVSRSKRLFSRAGQSFAKPGSSLAEDLMIFLLDTPFQEIQVLKGSLEPAQIGDKLSILGIPFKGGVDQAELDGTVTLSTTGRLEVQLNKITDLRGWGGGPAINSEGRVVGLLQATLKEKVFLTPISAVYDRIGAQVSGADSHFTSVIGKNQVPKTMDRPGVPPSLNVQKNRVNVSLRGPDTIDDALEALAVTLDIEHPPDQSIFSEPVGAFIAGKAHAHLGELRLFDVIFVIDTSGSTKQLTGTDVNQNGIVGKEGFFGIDDEGDSILAAEIAAAGQMLRGLDSRSTRVGIITFSGDPRTGFPPRLKSPAAKTEEPLTSDFAKVESTLREISKRKPAGMTHMAAGIDQATIELLGLKGSLSDKRIYSEKIVLFFTDGRPTLPYDQVFEAENVKAVLRAADRSARANIRIHSFAIGPEALEGPVATVEMAARTRGYFTPVRDPGELSEIAETVNFANVERLIVENTTTGAESNDIVIHADGSWGALVELKVGKNIIRVTALAGDGSQKQEKILLHFAPDAPPINLPREFVSRRNQLLEQKLLELRRASNEMADKTRRELRVEIERERNLATQKAAAQRRELDIRVDPLVANQKDLKPDKTLRDEPRKRH